MNDDEVDRLLRTSLGGHDVPRARVAAVRDAALRELQHRTRPRHRRWRAVEATASLVVAAAQLCWVIGTLFGAG